MKRKGSWMDRLTDQMDLAAEPLPGLPLVEIAGERRILIENHSGVSLYGPEHICVHVKFGQISVRGSGLSMAKMSRRQLVITGRVDSVNLVRRCGN